MLATNVIQALLVACVVLWVLDVPRQVLNVSFYTEQLLAVTLGLTLALAFITETRGSRARSTSAACCAVVAIVDLPRSITTTARSEIAWPMVVALVVGAGLDLHRQPRRLFALVRLALRHRLAAAGRLHHRPLRGADL